MKKRLLIPLLAFALAIPALAQQSVLAPGDNLVVEEIPPVPGALADAVNRYTEIRYAYIADWHPKRREMLITTRFGDSAQIHVVKRPGGARTQLTFFKDAARGASYQPTHGSYFVFSKDIGGNEQYQKYRYDVATGAITLLTDGKSRNTGGVWSKAGDRYAYMSTRRNNEDVDLWVMNPADPKTDRMLAQLKGGGAFATDWSADGKKIALLDQPSAEEGYVWVVDATTGRKELITPKGAVNVAYGDVHFDHAGKGVYVSTDKGSEFQRLAYIDLATRKHTYLSSHIPWDVDGFDVSPDGKLIAFVTNEDGLGVLHLLDAATKRERPVPKLPPGVISGAFWHHNSRDLAFGVESARSTSDAYSLDVTTGKVDRWTMSETGGLIATNLNEQQLVRWKAFDGRTISGFLYRPAAKFGGKRPVIIDIHGGPEGQSRPSFQGSYNYFLNELGVAVLYPNVRGSTGYGKTFLSLDNGFKREGAYKDIGALLDWIKTRPDLDADRVMVTGGSYGGHMTLAVATYYPDRIACALAYVGPSNLVTFLENTSAYRRDLRRVEYGDERDPKMREFLTRIAPANNVQKIRKPLFVVAGANDPRVPVTESEQMVKAVRGHGTPVWYLMAKDEGHGFAKKKNNDYLLYSTILFAREYLLK